MLKNKIIQIQISSTTGVSLWYVSLDFIFMFRVDIGVSSCGFSWEEENIVIVICFIHCVFPSTGHLHAKVSNFSFCFKYGCYYGTSICIDIPAQKLIIKI